MIHLQVKKTSNIITFTQFEDGNILTKARNDAESGDVSDNDSIMPPLMSEEEIDAMDSDDESDNNNISTEILEDIRDKIQSHTNVNRREVSYKIRDCIKQIQSE